jgi:hypothetical protein
MGSILFGTWTYVGVFFWGGGLGEGQFSASESYQLSVRSVVSEVNSELEQARAPNP